MYTRDDRTPTDLVSIIILIVVSVITYINKPAPENKAIEYMNTAGNSCILLADPVLSAKMKKMIKYF